MAAKHAPFCCPVCGSAEVGTTDSRPRSGGSIRRRRECGACKHRWTTIEISEAVFKSLISADTLAGHRRELKRLRDALDQMIGEA